MKKLTAYVIFSMVTCFLSTGATAENIYKCKDSYSQTPCPGGTRMDVTDPRTSAQKMAADQATLQDARTADRMEKARIQQEQADLAANTPLASPKKKASSSHTPKPKIKLKVKKNPKTPDDFTARAPAEKNQAKANKTLSPTRQIQGEPWVLH
jgi:hypothetical protein